MTNYRLQPGCWNCKHMSWYRPERSYLRNICLMKMPTGVPMVDWMPGAEVDQRGICDHHEKRKEKTDDE